ncbi:unnamed protein product [Paramecium sonneborni]|uniref:Uncharacterized protein n=1 Tax=Paramecium sonneborni TaxID=65129 RepID=A0A8S1RQS9_9CILI|nr:unnamed protein product [Paramecium sonneborni]
MNQHLKLQCGQLVHLKQKQQVIEIIQYLCLLVYYKGMKKRERKYQPLCKKSYIYVEFNLIPNILIK